MIDAKQAAKDLGLPPTVGVLMGYGAEILGASPELGKLLMVGVVVAWFAFTYGRRLLSWLRGVREDITALRAEIQASRAETAADIAHLRAEVQGWSTFAASNGFFNSGPTPVTPPASMPPPQ